MKSIFYQLYDGDLSRNVMTFERGSPYAAALDKLVDKEERLRAVLNKEQEHMLRAYSEAESDVSDIARREDFAAGIRLGVRLMLAILDEAPAMIHPEMKPQR